MNADERDQIASDIEREMSIRLKYSAKGWMATVNCFAAEMDNRKYYDDPHAALADAMNTYYETKKEELNQWHER